ncbi:MucR family transcriptional regulator [Methylobacterium variabile]|jgi:predicted transcriptional regulator|uniref:MucR family transcriptional regulator n=1 Tax=Methylobacterium variabile TaxID=298794 RepID=A0A0J6SSS4_9HYPH|nr:MucR family transcriptional regulator [Methylobacterium variabile]KMO36597.1 MucR family transcriptional regulator [Methylobacterium variabile]
MSHDGAAELDPISLAASIVSAYVSHNNIPPGEMTSLLQRVYDQLRTLEQPAASIPEPPAPPVPIKKTVTPDYIISLEDGRPYRTLKRHLAGRGLTPEAYRSKWGLPYDYPMVAASYAAQRSDLAKAAGLGRSRLKR